MIPLLGGFCSSSSYLILLVHISGSSLGDWNKDKTSRTGIKAQINNPFQSIHTDAFYFEEGWKMKLAKQEQVVAIGTFISMLGQDLIKGRINKQKLEIVNWTSNEMEYV